VKQSEARRSEGLTVSASTRELLMQAISMAPAGEFK
jgi:hypothetical protein